MGKVADKKPRKTLVQLQGEQSVKDPSQHAKRQVSELDKTAQRSLAKNKAIKEQLIADKKELEHLNHEIAELHKGYDPLVRDLKKKEEMKKHLLKQLDACTKQQRLIMDNVKDTVNRRKLDDMKLYSKMAMAKLENERGYSLGPSSTFRQSGALTLTKPGRSGMKATKKGLAASTGKLPAIGGAEGMKRNESSIL